MGQVRNDANGLFPLPLVARVYKDTPTLVSFASTMDSLRMSKKKRLKY